MNKLMFGNIFLHYLTFLFQPMATVRAICRFQWWLW